MKINDIFRRFWALFTVAAIALSAAGFTLGYFTRIWTQPSAVSSYEWVWGEIQKNYYDDVSEGDFLNSTLKGLTGGVLDSYSEYYTAEEYKKITSENAGNGSGLGVSYKFYSDSPIGTGVLVVSVMGNSPAYRCGIKKGMIITGGISGGTQVNFSSSSEFADFIQAQTAGKEYTLITDKGRFETYNCDYVTSYCSLSTGTKSWECVYDGGRLKVSETAEGIDCLPEGAAYLSLSKFYGDAAYQAAELIKKFNAENCTSLILDLRNNGGGSVDVMQYIAQLFIGDVAGASSTAMTAVYKSGKTAVYPVKKWTSGDTLIPAGTRVYVMANSGTASASEALMGVLISGGVTSYGQVYLSDFSQEYLDANTSAKNKRTYGKGIMQTTFVNKFTGEAVKLTTAKIYWPDGTCIHDRGITEADGCKTVSAYWNATYGDDELQKVIADIYGSQ